MCWTVVPPHKICPIPYDTYCINWNTSLLVKKIHKWLYLINFFSHCKMKVFPLFIKKKSRARYWHIIKKNCLSSMPSISNKKIEFVCMVLFGSRWKQLYLKYGFLNWPFTYHLIKGMNRTLLALTNTPWYRGHWKYLLPRTIPSFSPTTYPVKTGNINVWNWIHTWI